MTRFTRRVASSASHCGFSYWPFSGLKNSVRMVSDGASQRMRPMTSVVPDGFSRQHRGNSVLYRISDPSVHELCELVCGSIARRFDQAASARAAFTRPPTRTSRRTPAG